MSSFINKSGSKLAPKAPARRRGAHPVSSAKTPSEASARNTVEPSKTPQPENNIPSQRTAIVGAASTSTRTSAVNVSTENPDPLPRQPISTFDDSGVPVVRGSTPTPPRGSLLVSSVIRTRSESPTDAGALSGSRTSKRRRLGDAAFQDSTLETGAQSSQSLETSSRVQRPQAPAQSSTDATGSTPIAQKSVPLPKSRKRRITKAATNSAAQTSQEDSRLETLHIVSGSPAPTSSKTRRQVKPMLPSKSAAVEPIVEDDSLSQSGRDLDTASTAITNSSTVTGSGDPLHLDATTNQEDEWHVTTQADMTAESRKTKAPRLSSNYGAVNSNKTAGRGVAAGKRRMLSASRVPQDNARNNDNVPIENEVSKVGQSNPAARRLANAVKRKSKQLARSTFSRALTGRATATAIDETIAESVADRKKKRAPTKRLRESVAKENDTLLMTPGVIHMSDLTKDLKVGSVSTLEMKMRAINWAEVKKRRKEEEIRLTSQLRRKPTADTAKEGADDTGPLDAETLAENVANGTGGQSLKVRLVNGQHVVDEQTQFVDLRENQEELLSEHEEEDITRRFNSATYVTWRRKDPKERILTHEKWKEEETDRFYDHLSQFGTDFMVISEMFPNRTRRQVKAKFVKEERAHPERVTQALLGHLTRTSHGEGWNLKAFQDGSGTKDEDMLDPQEVYRALEAAKKVKEEEIEAAKKEAAAIEHQMREGGFLVDEEDEHGNPLTPAEALKKAREMAERQKREKKEARLAKKYGPAVGGEEEIIETIEEDD